MPTEVSVLCPQHKDLNYLGHHKLQEVFSGDEFNKIEFLTLSPEIKDPFVLVISPSSPPWEQTNPLRLLTDLEIQLVNKCGFVLINYLSEGYFSQREFKTFDGLFSWIQDSPISSDKIFYANTDVNLLTTFKKWESQCTAPATVNVLQSNISFWEMRMAILLEELQIPPWDPSGQFTFYFLNFKPKFERLSLGALLLEQNLLDKAICSFVKSPHEESVSWVNYTNRHAFSEQFLSELEPKVLEFSKKLPIVFDVKGDMGSRSLSFNAKTEPRCVGSCSFGLVCESEINEWGIGVSEKTLRSLCIGPPVLFYNTVGAIEATKKLGYVTFGAFFDESYDAIVDPGERMYRLIELVKEAASRDLSFWKKKTDILQEIQVHNLQNAKRRLANCRCEFFNIFSTIIKNN